MTKERKRPGMSKFELPTNLLSEKIALFTLPFDDEVADGRVNDFMQDTNACVELFEEMNGWSFTETERKYLNAFSRFCFRTGYFMTGRGGRDYAGKAAFAYGMVEAAITHVRGRDITSDHDRDDLIANMSLMDGALGIAADAGRSMQLGDKSGEFADTLWTIDANRRKVLSKQVLQGHFSEDSSAAVAYPIYVLAKNMALRAVDTKTFQSGATDFLLEELERSTVQTVYAELPSDREINAGDLVRRQDYTRVVTMMKDYFLRDVNWSAFAFGNLVMGEITGQDDFNKRFRDGCDLSVSDFYPNSQTDGYISESVPKSISSLLEKAVADEGIFYKLRALVNKYNNNARDRFGASFGSKDTEGNHIGLDLTQHRLYHVAIRERICALDQLIYMYQTDTNRAKMADIHDFIAEVRERIKSVPDIYRMRVYTQDLELDKFIQENKLAEDGGFIVREASRYSDEDEVAIHNPPIIGLGEAADDHSSAEHILDEWFEAEENEGNQKVFAGVFVQKPIIRNGRRIPSEIQFIPLKHAKKVWASRGNFKVATKEHLTLLPKSH